MRSKCVVKRIIHDKADPNDIPIEAIHASNVRLMTNFMCQPSPLLAHAIIRMLEALANHKDRFGNAGCGNIYAQAMGVWQRVVHDFDGEVASREDHDSLH
jgi:hypothetical protein